jgi:hypothetical protein
MWSAGEKEKIRMVLEGELKDRSHCEEQSIGEKLNGNGS